MFTLSPGPPACGPRCSYTTSTRRHEQAQGQGRDRGAGELCAPRAREAGKFNARPRAPPAFTLSSPFPVTPLTPSLSPPSRPSHSPPLSLTSPVISFLYTPFLMHVLPFHSPSFSLTSPVISFLYMPFLMHVLSLNRFSFTPFSPLLVSAAGDPFS